MTTSESAQVTPAASGTTGAMSSAAERAVAGERAPAAVRAERRAWLVIWLAFATLCALVFAVSKFAVDYVSNAVVNETAAVTDNRGQLVLSLPGSTEKTLLGNRSDLSVGTVLWLDRTTSVSLQLFDDSTVKLRGGSTLELTRMEVGRFINQHSVVLTQSSGPIQYMTREPIDVRVPGAVVHLAPEGDYTLWMVGDRTRVLVYGGEAHVVSDASGAVTASPGYRLEIDAKGQLSQLAGLPMQLLSNPDFGQHDSGWQALDVTEARDVNGTRSWVAGPDDNSTALRVVRQSINNEHGETGLSQPLDVDVSGYRHLWLRAWVRIDYADLSGGGTFGSEYPMMFRVKYEAATVGSFIPWAVGLYYSNQDNRPVPAGVAVPWAQQEWKPYQVDLMDTDPSSAPYRLLEFAVMSQGHSYDARVAGISLIGE